MAFRNSILAGEELVRSGIRSTNYQAGVAGWRVDRNGDAEFNNIAVRGILVAGDPAGAYIQIGDVNPLFAPIIRFFGVGADPGAIFVQPGLGYPEVNFQSPRLDVADGFAAIALRGEQPVFAEPARATINAPLLILTTPTILANGYPLAGAPLAFAPTCRINGTAITRGNGTLTGEYTVIAGFAIVTIDFVMGSTTGFGGAAGAMSFDLPINATGIAMGTCHLHRNSTGVRLDYQCRRSIANAGRVLMVNEADTITTDVVPWGWATSDNAHLTLMYRTA